MTDLDTALAAMEQKRGYIYPAHRYIAEKSPDFLQKYNDFVGQCLLHDEGDQQGAAFPAKYREIVVSAVLAFRGTSTDGVVRHLKRALALGATTDEVYEAFMAAAVPGGMPTFLAGIRALQEIEKDES